MLSDTYNLSYTYNLIFIQDWRSKQKTVKDLRLSVAVFELNRAIWQDFFPHGTFFWYSSYILWSWNNKKLSLKCNFLSSQSKSLTEGPSYLPINKDNWVQLKGKTLLQNFFICRPKRRKGCWGCIPTSGWKFICCKEKISSQWIEEVYKN